MKHLMTSFPAHHKAGEGGTAVYQSFGGTCDVCTSCMGPTEGSRVTCSRSHRLLVAGHWTKPSQVASKHIYLRAVLPPNFQPETPSSELFPWCLIGAVSQMLCVLSAIGQSQGVWYWFGLLHSVSELTLISIAQTGVSALALATGFNWLFQGLLHNTHSCFSPPTRTTQQLPNDIHIVQKLKCL